MRRTFIARAWLCVLLCAGVVSGLTGCGVGTQRHAATIASGDVPSGLLEPAPTPTPSVSGEAATSTVYMVAGSHVVPVQRPSSETSTLEDLLQTLLKGPTDAEAAEGLSTAINTSPTLGGVKVDGNVATVDLGSGFGAIRPPEQVLANAQLVLTTVSFPGIDAVRITLDGTPAPAPLIDGTLVTTPLTAADYVRLVGTLPAVPATATAVTAPPGAAATGAPLPSVTAGSP
jgi:hypothetical protein